MYVFYMAMQHFFFYIKQSYYMKKICQIFDYMGCEH